RTGRPSCARNCRSRPVHAAAPASATPCRARPRTPPRAGPPDTRRPACAARAGPSECPRGPRQTLASRTDPPETGVVVGSVVALGGAGDRLAAAHDAPRAPVALAGSGHGVFAVVAARLPGQVPLPVAEGHAVLAVAEWAAP